MSGVPDWMMAIAAERVRIAARLAAPVPEVTLESWERQTDILACYPLRADWEIARGSVGKDSYPVPVVSSRSPMAPTFPLPAPVLQLAEMAREQSWDVRMQYAQGHPPHGSTGKPTALRDSIALRFGNHPLTDRQAYACYEKPASGSTWVWSGIMIWGPDLPPFAGCGVTELRLFLDAPGAGHLMTAPEVAEWVAEISVRRAAQDAATKLRAKERAKTAMPKPREGMS